MLEDGFDSDFGGERCGDFDGCAVHDEVTMLR